MADHPGFKEYAAPTGQTGSSVILRVDTELISRFCRLFQRGVLFRVETGWSIRRFLCERIGLTNRFIEERVKTVFLNGKPVDDLDSAILSDGSTLALSAAMPGLLGATMRRGGYYAVFRSSITHRVSGAKVSRGNGTVMLKLFNLLLDELGPVLLENGIWIKPEELTDILVEWSRDLKPGCATAEVDGKDVALASFGQWKRRNNPEPVHLRIVVKTHRDGRQCTN